MRSPARLLPLASLCAGLLVQTLQASQSGAAQEDVLRELEARTRVWQQENPYSAPHWLSPDELGRMDEVGRTFTETLPPTMAPREIAEFEQMESVLVRYPFGISTSLIAAMSQELPVLTLVSGASQEATVRSQYTAAGVNLAACSFLYASTNSYWTRDYGPWFVQSGGEVAVVDFPYNRPRPLDDDIPWRVAAQLGMDCYGMNLIQTGGNWMGDGYGAAASSELVVEENPGMSEAQMSAKTWDYLGVDRYYRLPDPNNTYIDHIDCWAKFLDVDKVLVRQVPASHAQYDEIEATAAWFAATPSSWGRPYEVYRVWTPNNEPYTNSIILNGSVFVPVMNGSWDDEALAVYRQAMPGYTVQGFTGSWQSTDALHCRSKGIADRGLLHVHHVPLADSVEAGQALQLQLDITASSGQPLIADSLKCWHRVNGGSWSATALQPTGGRWMASLPALQPGQTLDYLLQAADQSGRFTQHPYTGRFDPHRCAARSTQLDSPILSQSREGTNLRLSWNAVAGALRYRLEGASSLAGPWEMEMETAESSVVIPLSASETRLWRVRALNP
jgi:agmatine deiminase